MNVNGIERNTVPVTPEGERSGIVRIVDEFLSQERQSAELLNIIVRIDQ